MLQLFKRTPAALPISLGGHLLVLGVMAFGADWGEKPKLPGNQVQVIQARVIPLDQLRPAPEQPPEQPPAPEPEEEPLTPERLEQERRNLEALEQRRAAERERLRQLEQEKQALEQKRREAEQRRRQEEERQQALEAERQRELERQRKLEQQQREDAERRKREQAERQRREQERQQQEAAERQRKAEEEAARRQAEAERQRQQAEARKQAEEAARRAAYEQRRTETIQAYSGKIRQKIEGSWYYAGYGEKLHCEIRVRLDQTGRVVAAKVVESSGNEAFDRSAKAAVYKAEPFPIPEDEEFIADFREITLPFSVDN